MTIYKVSYGRCTRGTFLRKRKNGTLVPGRLYFLSDTNEIFRANSESDCERYSTKVHVVDEFPSSSDGWVADNIYIRNDGRAKIAVDAGNDSVRIIEVTCAGGGGGGGGGDISDLRAAVTTIQNQLKWKPI